MFVERSRRVSAVLSRNLESLGLIAQDEMDMILTKYERDVWTSDKTTRRDFIAQQYRVLLLVGDDLNDFAYAGHKPDAATRAS